MMYNYVPFLAIKEKRKDLLPEPSKIEKSEVEAVGNRLKTILFRGKTPPSNPKVFFIEANIVSLSPSSFLKERWAKYYADLALHILRERGIYDVGDRIKIGDFLRIRRPYNELKLYHLEVEGGEVDVSRVRHLLEASILFTEILEWIEKIQPLASQIEVFREATKYLQPPTRKRGNKFIQTLLEAVGIPDGRKRILYYWLIPYWVTIEGKSNDEVLESALEWLSRQGGAKVYTSWILSEADNVRTKGIKPWSLGKVEKVDKELVNILREMRIV